MTQSRLFAAAPLPHPSLRLAEGEGGTVLRFPVMRPMDLRSSHGVEVSLDLLTAMAEAYNSQVEIATLNTDHFTFGPSLGNCTRVWMEGELLWAEWNQLDPEIEKELRAGKWPRRSAEFDLYHPSTGGAYLTGCALLGARRGAMKDLPPVGLGDPRPLIYLYEKETSMSDSQTPPPPAPPANAPPTNPPAPSESEVALAARLADLERREARLAAATRVRESIARLGTRVTPALSRAGVPELLTELALAATPNEIRLADGTTTVPNLFELAERVLGALPTNDGLFREVATPATAVDPAPRLAEQDKAIYAQHGIDDARLTALSQKYGAH